jgi:hypothetical protein
MKNFLKRRIEKLEWFEQPGKRLSVTDVTLTRESDSDPAEEIKVPYLKIDSVDQHGESIAHIFLPRNGRDEKESTPPANVG